MINLKVNINHLNKTLSNYKHNSILSQITQLIMMNKVMLKFRKVKRRRKRRRREVTTKPRTRLMRERDLNQQRTTWSVPQATCHPLLMEAKDTVLTKKEEISLMNYLFLMRKTINIKIGIIINFYDLLYLIITA